jgi:excinuclease ABC subunit A
MTMSGEDEGQTRGEREYNTETRPATGFHPPSSGALEGGFDGVIVRGAREHNLKGVDASIPRESLTVITGLSGSGKSSLAFDTIYAEGQRRYVESLSPYARQFLGLMERPEVDLIEGLSPAISIEQKTISNNPRSTVGTVTEIYDFLRLLFARAGVQHCVNCGQPVVRQTVDQIVDAVIAKFDGRRVSVLAPSVRRRKGHYQELFEKILRDGFTRVRIDGSIQEIVPGMKVDRYKIHDIEIVVDRLEITEPSHSRLAGSIETALKFGDGSLIIADWDNALPDALYSEKLACPVCNISYEVPEPNSFSFNSPYGACPGCEGLGEKFDFSIDLMIPDRRQSLNQEALRPLGKPRRNWQWAQVLAVVEHFGHDADTPIEQYKEDALDALLHGGGKTKFEITYTYPNGRTVTYNHRFDGVLKNLAHYLETTGSASTRQWLEAYMTSALCTTCNGGRLKPESLAVLIDGRNISDLVSLPIGDAIDAVRSLALNDRQREIGHLIVKEIAERLSFLLDVGLHYLTLNRSARTLSGGEAQRIRLATQIGSQLSGVLYVLDEPSIGLHQHDNGKLIASLKRLRDLGNTIIVVEHDRDMIESADYVIDLGPGAGELGGEVVGAAVPTAFLGSPATNGSGGASAAERPKTYGGSSGSESVPEDSVDMERSLTFQYLTGEREIALPEERRGGIGREIVLHGASGHNLKGVDLRLPLATFICITGLSGSGKSSLVTETLYPLLSQHFFRSSTPPLPYRSIEGLEEIDKVIDIDQSPIGRTPRSNPATYTGLFTYIRDLFTQLPESRIRGYSAGRFSFNVAGGRCEECLGDGLKKIEMSFLPDVYVSCEACDGKRYNRETLEVSYKGKSIAAVLDMTVADALAFFEDIPRIKRKLKTLNDVGLGYIRLGQQATTLSGGEAQRVKLATELSKIGTGSTLYVLDEPTTGLHFEDVRMLLKVLQSLVDKGNTVVIIEHNLDVIKCADWIIDLGPEGGRLGGEIVAEGPPETIAANERSYTGRYLRAELARSTTVPRIGEVKPAPKRRPRNPFGNDDMLDAPESAEGIKGQGDEGTKGRKAKKATKAKGVREKGERAKGTFGPSDPGSAGAAKKVAKSGSKSESKRGAKGSSATEASDAPSDVSTESPTKAGAPAVKSRRTLASKKTEDAGAEVVKKRRAASANKTIDAADDAGAISGAGADSPEAEAFGASSETAETSAKGSAKSDSREDAKKSGKRGVAAKSGSKKRG